jgi:hypothetical protein
VCLEGRSGDVASYAHEAVGGAGNEGCEAAADAGGGAGY